MSKRQKLMPNKRTQTIIDTLNISEIVKKYDYHLEGQVESSFSKEKIDFLIVSASRIVCICENKITYGDNKTITNCFNITCGTFISDNKIAVAGGSGISIWNLDTLGCIENSVANNYTINKISFYKDMIITTEYNGIKIWDLCLRELKIIKYGYFNIKYLNVCEIGIMVGFSSGDVEILDFNLQKITSIVGPDTRVMNISYILKNIVIVYEDKIRILDINFKDIGKFSLGHYLFGAYVLPNHTLLCSSFFRGQIIDLETFKSTKIHRIGHCRYSIQGSKLICLFGDKVEIIR